MSGNDRRASPARSRSKSPGRHGGGGKGDDDEVLPTAQRNAIRTYYLHKEKLEQLKDSELWLRDAELKERKKMDREKLKEAMIQRGGQPVLLSGLKTDEGKNLYLRLERTKRMKPSLVRDKVADAVNVVSVKDVTKIYEERSIKLKKSQTAVRRKRTRTIKPHTVGSNREPSPIRRIRDDFFDDGDDEESEAKTSRSRSPSPAVGGKGEEKRKSDDEASSSSKKRVRPAKKELSDEDLSVIYCLADAVAEKIHEMSCEVKERLVINERKPREACDSKPPPELVKVAREYLGADVERKTFKVELCKLRKTYSKEIENAKALLAAYMKTEMRQKFLVPVEKEVENGTKPKHELARVTLECKEIEAQVRTKAQIVEVVRDAVRTMFENRPVAETSLKPSDEKGSEALAKLLDPNKSKAAQFRRDLASAVLTKMNEWAKKNTKTKEGVCIKSREEEEPEQEEEEEEEPTGKLPLPSRLTQTPSQGEVTDASRKSPSAKKTTTFASSSNSADALIARAHDLKTQMMAKAASKKQ